MGSKASSATSTETNNYAMDLSATNGSGTQILDSIIVDPSDQVMMKTIEGHKAAFEVMMTNSSVQLSELLTLGSEIMTLADNQQIRLEGANYHMLDTGVRMLKEQMDAGKYVIDFVDMSTNRTFDLAEQLTNDSSSAVEQALEIVGDVKASTTTDMVQAISAFMVIFGLGALYLITRNKQ
ncbi:hypothetical protein [Pseudophaeobacter flagellatus]|uniref:hypothetical protein n=1 Tax=Pseudophaeobacter flagellatus TaxID=2899119 RepID=UPI001E418912|nr:hypothetical protein [Pseudophaeobacter flagellatus]MCD9147868.1 hypothetical protein [Pseudophaeobacter flagellatus]